MKQEEVFRDLVENSYDLIQSVRPDGRFLYVNRTWLVKLGYLKEEVPSLRVNDVIHPDSMEHCQKIMERVLSGHPATDIEATFVSKSGRRVLVQGSASCRFETGEPVATRGIFRDVTARRATEEELDRLFSLSLDLLCIAGVDGFFKRINPSFERVLGYSREELLSRSFLEFVHPDDRASTIKEVENLAQGRPTVDFHNRYLASDGTYRWLAWQASPLPSLGMIYAVARDITEQRENAELLEKQAKELHRSNADLEQFAYVASHDLRAPLRSISNLAEWIGEDLSEDRPQKVKEHVGRLQTRVSRMQSLIDDLLQYSRAGKDSGEVARVDTEELVNDIVHLLAPPEGFRVTVEPGMPVLETLRTPLEQVLRNLIGNAIQHHDEPQGEIIVEALERSDAYEFAVRDDGPGIRETSREEIFEMFSQLKSAGDAQGTGIGLALIKKIVEGQGGRVWVEPTEGRGSTFRFTWPKQIEG